MSCGRGLRSTWRLIYFIPSLTRQNWEAEGEDIVRLNSIMFGFHVSRVPVTSRRACRSVPGKEPMCSRVWDDLDSPGQLTLTCEEWRDKPRSRGRSRGCMAALLSSWPSWFFRAPLQHSPHQRWEEPHAPSVFPRDFSGMAPCHMKTALCTYIGTKEAIAG